jgi:phosphoserine phosphatase
MANIIAVIWDFDKTLIDGYMQEPIFRAYGVDAAEFWKEVNELPAKYYKEQGVRVNKDTIYLNHFIHYAKKGIFRGLSNEKLREFGKELKFFDGVPEIFDNTRRMIAENEKYAAYDIKVEHYIVSTGMTAVIEGSAVRPHVDGVWGCELIEDDSPDGRIISEVGYTIDNTTKTRAIFEINKGSNKNPAIDVNAAMPDNMRRVKFRNMIYVADGPSDVPAFSVIKSHGGATFAIYPHSDREAFTQVETLRSSGRIDTYAEADYREGSQAYMWISGKIGEFADRICSEEEEKILASVSGAPRHLD